MSAERQWVEGETLRFGDSPLTRSTLPDEAIIAILRAMAHLDRDVVDTPLLKCRKAAPLTEVRRGGGEKEN